VSTAPAKEPVAAYDRRDRDTVPLTYSVILFVMHTGLRDVPRRRGFGPFVSWAEYAAADGALVHWESRRQRKHARPGEASSTWWDPGARGWWLAILFAVGSILFAVGAVPGFSSAAGVRWDSITFFVGSVFFTVAAFLQYREMVDATPGGPPKGWRRYLTFGTRRIDWWATVVQLVGTVFFNVSTGNAIRIDLSTGSATHHVWRPDLLGSICFLVASALAWFEVCHGWGAWQTSSLSWWIVLVNLAGSVAFGASAVASYIVPETGQLLNVTLTNLGTFVGALLFLVGAVLLLPERTESLSG
jgi:hypothetical protein